MENSVILINGPTEGPKRDGEYRATAVFCTVVTLMSFTQAGVTTSKSFPGLAGSSAVPALFKAVAAGAAGMGTSPELTSFVGLGFFLGLDNRLYPPWPEPETWMHDGIPLGHL